MDGGKNGLISLFQMCSVVDGGKEFQLQQFHGVGC